VSRNDNRGDRPDWDSEPLPLAGSSGVDNFARISFAQPGERRPVSQPEVSSRIRSGRNRMRDTVFAGDRRCRISEAERVLLKTLGAFRAVAVSDLVRHLYAGSQRRFAQDFRNLSGQGLVRKHRLMAGNVGEIWQVLVLTPKAKAVLAAVGTGNIRQVIHVGFVKPREIAHDAALYRMYEAEASQIRSQGGTIRRIVLDHELKASICSELAKTRSLPRVDYARLQREIAHAHGLPMAGGRILLPDLRLEYESADGELTKVDLELATRHYHGAYALEKARVGFKLYTDGPSSARLNARLTLGRAVVPDGPGLTDAILSL
jgi:hypothetical protein